MNLRRKLVAVIFGGLLGAAVNLYSKKAQANPLDDLFEEALEYISDIIIRYYGQRWYENTQEQMQEWGEFNGDQTVQEENTLRVDYARLGDSLNATEKELANRELMADTEPTPLDCLGGESNIIKEAGKVSVENEKALRSNLRNPNIKTLSDNSREGIDDYQIDISNDEGVNALSASIADPVNYLMNGFGYTAPELDAINQFMAASMPRTEQINLIGVGSRADRKNGERASRIAKVNVVKSTLDHLLAKRTKVQVGNLDSRLEDLAKYYYRNNNSSLGLSDSEILQINVDLYTKNKELNAKVNGSEGFASFVPIGILLSEMKSIENKLISEIAETDSEINKLLAIQCLLEAEAN
ncbi:hypothetical protein GCM10011607_28290 [Shewanella inventionis]|uniref:Uncharacterized protein n=1 Tax=Shewanella inventionis TaxID=1738770 RepID=A0ABQ1JFI0_9GAMM|nr:hypothetical protein [Shewanella inventionis]GGB65922.1 hypothetical protein GCM10011607_28290 [Shewanella inventionis]